MTPERLVKVGRAIEQVANETALLLIAIGLVEWLGEIVLRHL